MAMFDVANNRLSYGELLQPELGYELEFAVGLTYSLDLEALLGIPVSFGLLDEVDSSLMKSPFYMLEAIRKSGDRLAIFCNAGGISLPKNIQSVYSLLEKSVFEIRLPNRQNFHPKLWFAKYINGEGESYIKVLVLSRNMTFDSSIDLCVELKGDIKRRPYLKNKPLADMLSFVSKYAEKSKRQRIINLSEDIMKVRLFDVNHPFEDYEFLPIGIDDYDKDNTKLFEGKYDLFAVSPFLSDDIVKGLTNCNHNKVLITRKASVTKTVLDRFDSVYITKDILSDNEYGVKQDIHAKMYFTRSQEGNYLYVGSANASYNAFHNNVEFLLKLKYKPRCVGFKMIFEDFIPEEHCPFELITTVPDDLIVDNEKIIIEKAVKEAIYAIKGAKITCDGDTYKVVIKTKELTSGVPIKVAPMQRQNMNRDLQQETLFEGMLLKELSDFFILSIYDKKLVIKIKTKGMPEDRDDAIYKNIIDSKSKFLSYVSLILADNFATGVIEESEYLRLMMGNDNDENKYPTISALYEKMLKAVHQHPGRLKEIANIIEKLDDGIVSDEFLKMYQKFERAARRLTK